MPLSPDEVTRLKQQFDQGTPALRVLMGMLRDVHSMATSVGFSDAQAFELVQTYWSMTLSRAHPS